MATSSFTEAQTKILTSRDCYYFNFDDLGSSSLADQLAPTIPEVCDMVPLKVNVDRGIGFSDALGRLFGGPYYFDGYVTSRWTSEHWELPLAACAIYLAMICVLKRQMARRERILLRPVVLAWNFGLSAFSFAGVYYCVPHLLWGPETGVLTHGLYDSVCTHAASYGFGSSGFFVFLFIYSKLAELLDTLWLLLRKSPVILLHWYHHVTVLLYCWHAYSIRIGTGLWFAAMNYSVHAVMYLYFGLTQTGPAGRRFAKRFAFWITVMQLAQMVGGIWITAASVYYISQGRTCYVPLVNSGLGLVMYASYFALFLQLFLNAYFRPSSKGTRIGPSHEERRKGV